jgi:hypothetical protein
MTDPLIAQIANEVGSTLPPLGALLGVDILDAMQERLRDRQVSIAALLRDETTAADTASDLMHVIWGQGDAPPDWWRSPLGAASARALGADDGEAVSWRSAAAILGVHPGTVAQLVHGGKLDWHPDGGLTRSSVLLRLASR